MGNRAVITTQDMEYGIYVHWNGGYDSVNAFLTWCKNKGFPSPEKDLDSWIRLKIVLDNFFESNHTAQLGFFRELDYDNYDNGTYIIREWEIVDRKYKRKPEQQQHSLGKLLELLDKANAHVDWDW